MGLLGGKNLEIDTVLRSRVLEATPGATSKDKNLGLGYPTSPHKKNCFVV